MGVSLPQKGESVWILSGGMEFNVNSFERISVDPKHKGMHYRQCMCEG